MKASAVVLAAGLACQGASGQWVSFSDETASRLQLTTVSMSDNQEKDLATADLNKDGWADVVVGRKTPFSNPGKKQALLLMNEKGVLVDRTAELAPALMTRHMDVRDVLIADFNGDGWLDVLFGNTFDDPTGLFMNRGVDGQGQWLGLADESWRVGPVLNKPNKVCAVWAGDIDGDGDLDVYFSSYSGGTDFLMVNDGQGNFKDETAARLGAYAANGFGTAVEFQDMDQDGHLDVVKCTTNFSVPPFNSGGVFVLWNDGTGKFNSFPFTQVGPTSSAYMMSTNDLNNDGVRDVYVVQDPQDQTIIVKINGPKSLSFTGKQVSSPRTTGFGGDNKGGDVDRDGFIDYGVGPVDVDIPNCGSGKYALLKNDGTGKMVDPWTSSQSQNIHTNTWDFVFMDVNNDGCLDIVQGLCVGWRVFIQEDCPQKCYADCDQSGSLNIDDFLCFQLKFALQDPYADCDQNNAFNIDDFLCFQLGFALGCH